jgi:hypothetical protein
MATLQGFDSEQEYQRAYDNAPFVHRDVSTLQLRVMYGSQRLRAWCRSRKQPIAVADRLVSGLRWVQRVEFPLTFPRRRRS